MKRRPGIFRNWTNTAIHLAAYVGLILIALAMCSGVTP